MAVNLSPVGGVAAQFFTNTGAVLTGGKIYTYAAGTTTPAVTYTSSNGATAQPNPIVLDAAGRVPNSGEIWLTDGINYKFVLKDSNDVLIATYDNITGINSNAVAYTNQQQIIVATAGQTVFNLGISYQVATNSLSVFVDGVNQYGPGAQYAYTETSSTSVTFNNGLHVGAVVKFTTTQQQGAGAVDAAQVSYTPAGTGAVTTNVQAKLRQTVNIIDFGGDPSGATSTNTAYTNAVAYITSTGKEYTLQFPPGTYKFTSGITLDITLMSIACDNATFDFSTIATSATALTVTGTTGDIYSNLKTCLSGAIIKGPGVSGTSIGIYFNAATTTGPDHIELSNVGITSFAYGTTYGSNAYIITFNHCNVYGNARGFQSYVGAGPNSGERISFVNSSIFNNSAYGIRIEDSNSSIHFVNTSIDYNVQALFLSVGFVHFSSCYFEFSDQISGNDPRFLFADGGGTNTSSVTYSDCTFKIGAVASSTATPVFDVTSTTTVSHSNCIFYLNTNRSIIFKMRTGSAYNEVNATIGYAGASFRALDSGCAYAISSSGSNSIGIKTTSDVVALAPNYVVGGITPISDIFTSAFATGNVATSNIALANGVYTLFTHTQLSANSATFGQYLISRMGTQTVVTTITADAGVAVTVNGSFNVVVTNTSGSGRTLDNVLQRNTAQNI